MTQLDGAESQAAVHYSYLERSNSVIVNCRHLILCQSISSLVVNLKTSIELKHVQKLKGYIYITKLSEHKNKKPLTKTLIKNKQVHVTSPRC